MSKTILRHTLIKKYFWHFSWLLYLYTFSLYENASLIIFSAETEAEDLYKGIAKQYGMDLKIPKALLDDKTFFCRLIEECRKDIDHHSGVNSRGNEYFPAALLELVMKYQQQQHTKIVDTILNSMSKTLNAQSSSTVVILCHRSVKSAMIKADEEDYKDQKEMFGKFIEENKFYYNDRFLEWRSTFLFFYFYFFMSLLNMKYVYNII